jgi:DNA-binding transcriptional ArsR family regulator
MVKSQATLDATFGALSDGTRRAMLQRLAHSPLSTTDLARPFAISLPAVLKHLHVLEQAGLIQGEKRGRVRRYRLNPQPMREAAAWIDRYQTFWETQLDALEHYMKESTADD